MVQKNVAGQKFALKASFAASQAAPNGGAPVTGDAANITPYVSKNFGALTAVVSPSVTEIDATHAPGWYKFTLSQSETAGDQLLFTAVSTTAFVVFNEQVVATTPPDFGSAWIQAGGGTVVTDGIVVFNGDKVGYALSAASITAIWAATMEGAFTAIQYMRLFAAALLGKASGLPTAPKFRDTGDTKDRIVATTDSSGDRSAVTLDGT